MWNLVNILIHTQHILTHVLKGLLHHARYNADSNIFIILQSTVQTSYIFTLTNKMLAIAFHSFNHYGVWGDSLKKTHYKNVFCNHDLVLHCSSKNHVSSSCKILLLATCIQTTLQSFKNCIPSGLTKILWTLSI